MIAPAGTESAAVVVVVVVVGVVGAVEVAVVAEWAGGPDSIVVGSGFF